MRYAWHVLAHKWRMLFQGLPLWLALLHDCDKFWPDEFGPYSQAFVGGHPKFTRDAGFYRAWHKHQRRTKHHWQAWTLIEDNGDQKALPIPDLYRREMLADWRAASAAAGSTAVVWYTANWNKILLHPETEAWVRKELGL
jgi:hypothetical protein